METTEIYETGITDRLGNPVNYFTWSAEDIEKDLVVQGRLEPSYTRVEQAGFHSYLSVNLGSYKGNKFFMRWIKSDFLVLMLEMDDSELVTAFSRIVNKRPFIRYSHPIDRLLTFEWNLDNALSDEEKREESMKRFMVLEKRFEGISGTGLELIDD